MFTKLKLWLVALGGAVGGILLLLLAVFNRGRQVERAQGIEDAAKAEEKFDDRVNEAHKAGDSARIDAADPARLRVDDGHKRKRKAE